MADTYTSSNRLALQATGDNPTTWGQRLNTRVFDMVDEALDGVNELDITVTTAYSLTTASGTTDQARKRTLHITGTATANATVTVPALNKFYVVKCSYTGAYTVTIKTASDAGVAFTAGDGGLVFVTSSGVFEVLRKSDMLLAANNLSDLTDTEAARTALGMGNPTVNTFTNDGSTIARTLSQDPGTVNAIIVIFDGVVQTPTLDYTLSGTTLTYVTQPANGTKELIFIGNQSLPAGEPSDGSVDLTKLSSSVYASEAEALAGSDNTKLMTPLRVAQALDAAPKLTLSASQATTSGTYVDFTIPADAKRVTLNLSGVSTNGSDNWIVQLGDSGGVETSGYLGTGAHISGGSISNAVYTTGFGIHSNSSSRVVSGGLILTLLDDATNLWQASGVLGCSDSSFILFVGGSKALSGELTTVRLTTLAGTNTFDAGSASVSIEA